VSFYDTPDACGTGYPCAHFSVQAKFLKKSGLCRKLIWPIAMAVTSYFWSPSKALLRSYQLPPRTPFRESSPLICSLNHNLFRFRSPSPNRFSPAATMHSSFERGVQSGNRFALLDSYSIESTGTTMSLTRIRRCGADMHRKHMRWKSIDPKIVALRQKVTAAQQEFDMTITFH
jgi:hypothetical protein